ncbi:PIN domain-containing protein [Candidatus Poribacteria bacterium]|nr:PIN domain-containing protein [Candidatus Poribacteria bacterium]
MTNATLVSEFVTNTIGFVLRIERRRLSEKVKTIFDSVEFGNTIVYVPGIVFAEILYLSEKQRIRTSIDEVEDYLKEHPNYKEYSLNFAVIQSTAEITDIPELHDRLIAATARQLDLELITNDSVIQASAFVKTIW